MAVPVHPFAQCDYGLSQQYPDALPIQDEVNAEVAAALATTANQCVFANPLTTKL